MAMKASYLTVDGEIRSEHRTGDTHTRDYILDALGSVVEVFQGTSVVADASYKPYGAMVSGSWNMASYRFRWVGGLGYRYTGLDWVTAYVRARHYSYNDGAWTSVDPLWPRQPAYRYVNGRVTAYADPSGMNGQGYDPGPTVKTKIPTWRPPDTPREIVPGAESPYPRTNNSDVRTAENVLEILGLVLKGTSCIGLILTPTRTGGGDVMGPTRILDLDMIYEMKGYDRSKKQDPCDSMWIAKDNLCGLKKTCKQADQCSDLPGYYENAWNCAHQRIQLLYRCSEKNKQGWMCQHVGEFCKVLSGLTKCGSAIKKCPGINHDVVTSAVMARTIKQCRAWEKMCKSRPGHDITKKKSPDFPKDY